MCSNEAVPPESQARIRELYERRIEQLRDRLAAGGAAPDDLEAPAAWRHWRRSLIDAERERLIELRSAGEIRNEVARRIERDLDLEEARWT